MTGTIDREVIVHTARRMLERDGVESLSMRKLAAELGSKPMSLYYYVPSKDDLLLAVLTAVADEIEWQEPRADRSPRDRMVQVVEDMADRLSEIDWVVDVLRSGTHIGPPALVLADRFIAAAHEAGATPQEALDTWRACWYLVASELQWQRGLASRSADDVSWYARIDRKALDNLPMVRGMIDEWPALSAGFDLRAAIIAQVDGASASWGRCPAR